LARNFHVLVVGYYFDLSFELLKEKEKEFHFKSNSILNISELHNELETAAYSWALLNIPSTLYFIEVDYSVNPEVFREVIFNFFFFSFLVLFFKN